MKVNLVFPRVKKWGGVLEMQYRRQSDYHISDYNVFRYPLGFSVRPWLLYSPGGRWTILLSPGGYFQTEDIPETNGTRIQRELRISPGVQYTVKAGKFRFKNRFLYEARFLNPGSSGAVFQSRLRAQQEVVSQLSPASVHTHFGLQLAHEIFVKKQGSCSAFDQDRLSAIVQWTKHKSEFGFGYQWSIQQHSVKAIRRQQVIFAIGIQI